MKGMRWKNEGAAKQGDSAESRGLLRRGVEWCVLTLEHQSCDGRIQHVTTQKQMYGLGHDSVQHRIKTPQ